MPVFPASDLRLRLSTIEMSRLAAERRKAIPKRKRRPDHSITYPARPLIPIITIPAQPAVIPVITIPDPPANIPVITIVCDRAQSPYRTIPTQKIFSEGYSSQGISIVRSSLSPLADPSPPQKKPQKILSPSK